VPLWPFEGAVAIKDGEKMIVLNKWCYLGMASDYDELDELVTSSQPKFDLDIYKIIKKALSGSHKDKVISCLAQ
jgi:DNA polymerase-3 subunit epsilon